MKINEITRLTKSGFTGGKKTLYVGDISKQVKKLPGGSGLLYSTGPNRWGDLEVKLWDPQGAEFANDTPRPVKAPGESTYRYEARLHDWDRKQDRKNAPGQIIGKLSISNAKWFPLAGAVQVDTITVDEDYRGMGLAKSLYGIVLTLMKRPLISGDSQTPGGRRNWLSLSQIPGVEMKGYVAVHDTALQNHQIDTIMGQLGGQYIGAGGYQDRTHYFAFDVVPGTGELAPAVLTSLSKVYGASNFNIGLYAVWTSK
jgi:hypothetical protein